MMKEFATRHHFNDGNKRFSHVLAKLLLLADGYHLEIGYKTVVPFVISIAADKLTCRNVTGLNSTGGFCANQVGWCQKSTKNHMSCFDF